MGRTSRVALGGMALALGMIGQPASALSTAGWSQADRSAATIREFQTRLMVAALRCRAAGINVLASYNQFIAADRAEIAAANDRLKARFRSASPATGERDYDRYTTSLANGFAGEQWSPASCDRANRLAREAAQSRGNLLAVATRTSDVAEASSPSWPAYNRPAPQAYADRGPPPGYGSGGAPRGYDDWQSPWGDDRGAPPRYSEDSPSWQARHAYADQPPPGYYDEAPSVYDDRAPPPGYGY